MPRITDLDVELRDANIPINGIGGGALGVAVWFKPEATQQNKDDASAIINTFDWTERRPRGYQVLIDAIAALSAADRNKLLAAVAADFLRRNPRFAQKFSIAILGDEPDV